MAASRSISLYALYMGLLGALLILVPNHLLSLFGFAPTSEVWIRVVGVLVFVLGFFYAMAGRTANIAMIRWTVPARLGILATFSLFVLAGWAKPMLILFGLVDAAGAVWTWASLRRDEE